MTEFTAHHGMFRNTTLHVDDTGGSGRPVVLIHGWPLSGESWSEQVPALERAGYRVVTYDRRGFGRSDKPARGYDYDTLADDLHTLVVELALHDVTLVGFSMGGGEVARYFTLFGPERLRSVVFASAVTPYLLQTGDNPEGPLTEDEASRRAAALAGDRNAFYNGFVTTFFSVRGELQVTERQRHDALRLCGQADPKAALACMASFGGTDFREDLARVDVPSLVLHGDGDATVPFAGSGRRTHQALPASRLEVIPDAPHGCNVSHADDWNERLLDFLAK